MADKEHLLGSIRSRYRDLEPFASDLDPNKAYALYHSLAPVTPLGHARQTINSTPATLTGLPAATKKVHMYNLSEDTTVWFTDYTGQDPGAALGFPIRPDSWFVYDAEPTSDFKLATVSGTASLAIAFYG